MRWRLERHCKHQMSVSLLVANYTKCVIFLAHRRQQWSCSLKCEWMIMWTKLKWHCGDIKEREKKAEHIIKNTDETFDANMIAVADFPWCFHVTSDRVGMTFTRLINQQVTTAVRLAGIRQFLESLLLLPHKKKYLRSRHKSSGVPIFHPHTNSIWKGTRKNQRVWFIGMHKCLNVQGSTRTWNLEAPTHALNERSPWHHNAELYKLKKKEVGVGGREKKNMLPTM